MIQTNGTAARSRAARHGTEPPRGAHANDATSIAANNHTTPNLHRLMRAAAAGIMDSGAHHFRQLRVAMLARGAHEPGEQRMAVARCRGEFRVELGGHEPRVSR